MITVDTITDEQIRELFKASNGDHRTSKACLCALGLSRGGLTAKARARVRCAEILNARAKEAK